MSGHPNLRSTDPDALVAKFSRDLMVAAMAGVERAVIDQQGQTFTLDELSLRWAIYSGIAAYLADEIAKKQACGGPR